MKIFRDIPACSDVVRVSLVSHASTNIERDRQGRAVRGRRQTRWLPYGASADGMNGSKRGTAISIIGPYGSGKSTLGLFINRLVGSRNRVCRKAIDVVMMPSQANTCQIRVPRRKEPFGSRLTVME